MQQHTCGCLTCWFLSTTSLHQSINQIIREGLRLEDKHIHVLAECEHAYAHCSQTERDVNAPEPEAAAGVCCCSGCSEASGEADEGVELPELELKLGAVVGPEADGTDGESAPAVEVGLDSTGAAKQNTAKQLETGCSETEKSR